MKKSLLLIIGLLLLALVGLFLLANAMNFSITPNNNQSRRIVNGEVTVNKTVHNFRTIKENGGSVSATFIVRNGTETPIVLTNVVTSCGCTAPDWTKSPIESGKSGEVTVVFDPKGQTGSFNKSVTINTNGKPERLDVSIRGMVEE